MDEYGIFVLFYPEAVQNRLRMPMPVLRPHSLDEQHLHNHVNMPEGVICVGDAVVGGPTGELLVDALNHLTLGALEGQDVVAQLVLNVVDCAVGRPDGDCAAFLLEVPRKKVKALRDVKNIGFLGVHAETALK